VRLPAGRYEAGIGLTMTKSGVSAGTVALANAEVAKSTREPAAEFVTFVAGLATSTGLEPVASRAKRLAFDTRFWNELRIRS
jgi:hypothetical protein